MKFEIRGEAKQHRKISMRFDVANQFDCEGEWLRGNLHCHVKQMGGAEKACAFYRRLGFQFLASTDYLRVTEMPVSTADFITLPGAEMYGSGAVSGHIICIGLKNELVPPTVSLDDLARMLGEVQAMGGAAHLAHPFWSGFAWEELLRMAQTGITGFELSNRLCWRINGKGRAEELWQMLLDKGIRLAAIGVDDAHADPNMDLDVAGHTWTGVLARDRTPAGVLDAIRSHRTYASEGPVLRSIRFEPRGAVIVESSECIACHFMACGSGMRTIHARQGAEKFEVDLARDGYRLSERLAICLEDKHGRRAWSSAIPVRNEIGDL